MQTVKHRRLRAALRQQFVKGACKLILAAGGRAVGNPAYEYELDTPVGLLRLSVTENSTEGPGTVFCRFEDHVRAHAAGIDCNRFSGKWNHHYFGEYTVPQALEHFEGMLRYALKERP